MLGMDDDEGEVVVYLHHDGNCWREVKDYCKNEFGVVPFYAKPIPPAIPEGMVLVPVEPTDAMIEIGCRTLFLSHDGQMRRQYQAMIAAAQKGS